MNITGNTCTAIWWFVAALASAIPPAGFARGSDREPSANFVLILADDQGWTGSSVVMNPAIPSSVSDLYQTPALQKLAAAGITLSSAYAPAPNCSPTRMSIQTGKSAPRLGATDIIDVVPDAAGRAKYQAFHDRSYINKPLLVKLPVAELPLAEQTIAELLKAREPNYSTAHFGKWHMGQISPSKHGYDEHDGATSNDEGRADLPDPKLTSQITQRAVEFINARSADSRPFFLQISYYAVHAPLKAHASTISRFRERSSLLHTNSAYAAMTAELDAGVGRVLAALEETNLADNTYVIYTSDNGAETWYTTNAPLKRGKTSVWEGGIRVPMLVRGPGITPGTRSNVPVIGYDLLPTIAAWADAEGLLAPDIDGGSLAALLTGGREVSRQTEPLIWYYGAYRNHKHVVPQAAIRSGNYKLIREFDSDRSLLFNLDLDLSETTDISPFEPALARRLESQMYGYLNRVGVTLPTINRTYDPALDQGLTPFVPGQQ